jgi:hypothetical protein
MRDNSIFHTLLKHNGYKEFKPNELLAPYACAAFQKCVKKEGVKLYFITVYEYPPFVDEKAPSNGRYEADGQFETDRGLTFNVKLHHGWSIADLEDFFDKIYHSMGCNPYGV